MSDLSDTATRLAILSALHSQVTSVYKQARAASSDHMDAGDRKSVRLGDNPLGDVIMTKGTTRAKVTNHEAFTAWVAKNHPDEIVQSVRKSYLDKVLADAKQHGMGVDVTTGEVIPGVEVETSEPHVAVRLADDAAETISAHWESALQHVPELPGGEQ